MSLNAKSDFVLMLQEGNSVHLQNSKSMLEARWAPPSPLAGGSLGVTADQAQRSALGSQPCASVCPPRTAQVFSIGQNRPAPASRAALLSDSAASCWPAARGDII